MKIKISKGKWFAALISLLTSVMSFSIGFGIWSIQAVDTNQVVGNVQTENVLGGSGGPVAGVFTFSNLKGLTLNEYGFLQDDGSFAKTSGKVSGTLSFKPSVAYSAQALRTTSIVINVSFGVYSNGAFVSSNSDINVSAMALKQGSTTISGGSITYSNNTFNIAYNYTVADTTASNVDFTFEFTVTTVSTYSDTFVTNYENATFKVVVSAEDA